MMNLVVPSTPVQERYKNVENTKVHNQFIEKNRRPVAECALMIENDANGDCRIMCNE